MLTARDSTQIKKKAILTIKIIKKKIGWVIIIIIIIIIKTVYNVEKY